MCAVLRSSRPRLYSSSARSPRVRPAANPWSPTRNPRSKSARSGAVAIGTSASDLQNALDAAQPGSAIRLADTTYAGHFTITVSGSDGAPITLCGSAAAVIDGGPNDSGYALHLDGASHWVVRGFTVTGAAKGVTALAEIPQFCSSKFPTLGRSAA